MYKQKQYNTRPQSSSHWQLSEHSCEDKFQEIDNFKSLEELEIILEQIPHGDLKNIFYDPITNTVKGVQFGDAFSRLKRVSIFKSTVQPSVQDKKNQKIIYLIYYGLTDYQIINEIWQDIYQSYLIGMLSKNQNLNGIIVSDKASDNIKVGIRFEFWFSDDDVEGVKNIIFKSIQSKYFRQGGHKAKCFTINPSDIKEQ